VDDVDVVVPGFMARVVAEISQLARASHEVNQRSGVSVRMTVANAEVAAASAVRRAMELGEDTAAPRVCDLDALVASTAGKIELDTIDDDAGDEVFAHLVSAAVLSVFRELVGVENAAAVVAGFEDGSVVSVGDDIP